MESRRIGYWLIATIALLLTSIFSFAVSQQAFALLTALGSAVPFWKSIVVPAVKLFTINPAEAANKNFAERIGFLQEFNSEFERVVRALPSNNFLAIFVDDLDRCPPDRVADVLEALNRLMESRSCFVVLGIDPKTVQSCVELRYKDLVERLAEREPGGVSFGEKFLQKLVGIAVHAPPVLAGDVPAKRTRAAPPSAWRRLLAGGYRRLDQVLVIASVGLLTSIGAYWWDHSPEEAKQLAAQWIPSLAMTETPPASAPPKTALPPPATAPVPATAAEAPSREQTPLPVKVLKSGALKEQAQPKKPAKAAKRTVTPVLPAERVLAAPAVLSVEPTPVLDTRLALFPAAEREQAVLKNQLLVAACWSAALLFVFAMTLALYHEIAIKQRSQPLSDSPAFANGLAKSEVAIANPRQRLRFKNFARLTYYLVAGSDNARSQPGWEPEFFRLLSANALDKENAESTDSSWLGQELNRWLGRIPAPASQRSTSRSESGSVRRAGAQD